MTNRTARRSASSTRTARRSASSARTTSTARSGFGKGRPRHASPVPPAPGSLNLGKFQLDTANKGNGITLLRTLPENAVKTAFFDPQYPGGVKNWKKLRAKGNNIQKRRAELPQMSEAIIERFFRELARVIAPSGHVFLWVDNFHARTGISHWIEGTDFEIVDKIVWAKGMTTAENGAVGGSGKMGLGSRARRSSEELFVLQKLPKRVEGCWTRKNIRDVWMEKVDTKAHVHAKPMELQKALIEATTQPGDLVLDPCAGSFSVMDAAHALDRRFIGCDLGGGKRRPVIATEQELAEAMRVSKTGTAARCRAKARLMSVKAAETAAAKPKRSAAVRPKPVAKRRPSAAAKSASTVSRASTLKSVAKTRRAAPARPKTTRKAVCKVSPPQLRAYTLPRDLLDGDSFVLVPMPVQVLDMLAANQAAWSSSSTPPGRRPGARTLAGPVAE
ncbi:hypothetical protein B1992_10335 [Pseudoxanthomonas broegbernensis]|uniref:site-specific DNA-methyltransferase (adenine-specific) n=1 Tax=Pseudoxanthomonas broegbernensis TaxID=83619 RepID=A0A7V8K6X0_9GAMM|nr:site-specific DNA-methyltransferase [Pseudoxanthomonas broegbernensis]KAF1685864.1 hypothetical protein B1992_10335 [Pseudoxanthomonas broegbernensis]MBB6064080.1 DNA modification methylase [Pseudoxanthomonas broegbernensis]